MTRVLCGISGIEYTCEHMQLYLSSREAVHPIFHIPPTRLLKLLDRWLDQDMTEIENYLLYLSIWNATGLVEFRSPAIRTPETSSIIASNIIPLARMLELILNSSQDRIEHIFHLPHFVITPDTQDLEASGEWIKIWESCYADYQNKYVTATAQDKLNKQESILERYIKDKTKDISQYALQLANWASAAGKFDIHANYMVLNEHDKPELMSSYWKRIIIACARSESIWDFPEVDLQDVYDHCQDNISHGDIFAHTLMALLKSGIKRRDSFTNLGNIDLGNGQITFRILDADASIEDANKLAAIDSAPLEAPIKANYPSTIAFLRAKMNYKLAQEYKEQARVREMIENASLTLEQQEAKKIAHFERLEKELKMNLSSPSKGPITSNTISPEDL